MCINRPIGILVYRSPFPFQCLGSQHFFGKIFAQRVTVEVHVLPQPVYKRAVGLVVVARHLYFAWCHFVGVLLALACDGQVEGP